MTVGGDRAWPPSARAWKQKSIHSLPSSAQGTSTQLETSGDARMERRRNPQLHDARRRAANEMLAEATRQEKRQAQTSSRRKVCSSGKASGRTGRKTSIVIVTTRQKQAPENRGQKAVLASSRVPGWMHPCFARAFSFSPPRFFPVSLLIHMLGTTASLRSSFLILHPLVVSSCHCCHHYFFALHVARPCEAPSLTRCDVPISRLSLPV